MMRTSYFILLATLALVSGFTPKQRARPSVALFSTLTSEMTLTLSKPLGMILEENEEGQPKGVFVKEIVEGSAAEHKNTILNAKLIKVQDTDVSTLLFDAVMETIIDAPEDVTIVFETLEEKYKVGDIVSLIVDGKEISAKVGNNLRQTLLDNEIEVYQGLKQKLGNCGGGGQCTFCAFDFLESDGWEERSEYEDKKLAKNPQARLTCLNNIQGPATLQKAKR